MNARGHLRSAQQLLALAGDRELTDERRAAQVAEGQAHAVTGVLAFLVAEAEPADDEPDADA